MVERTAIIDLSGGHEETVLQLAKHLRRNQLRRKIYNTIYGRGSRPRSKLQIMRAARIPDRHSQQAQNQLDHLAKHHLILRVENDGSVRDGSRNLYRKEPNIRAIREEFVKYADNPKLAKSVPTKRRPFSGGLKFEELPEKLWVRRNDSMCHILQRALTRRIRSE